VPDRLTLQLAVIPPPAPDTRAVFITPGPDTVYFHGEGLVDAVCGQCGAVLTEGVGLNQVEGIVLVCAACGAHNESGVYQLARGGLQFLVSRKATVDQLRELLDALKRSRDDGSDLASPGEPDLVRRFADLLPRTRQYYYTLLVVLIALLTLWIGERTLQATEHPAPPSDTQVEQIVTQVLHDSPAPASGPVTNPPRPGRNEPCPCGSGRKFKHCQGRDR